MPCQIQVLSLILLVTLGNPLLGRYLKLGRIGETSLKQNTSLRRGEDIDLLPPLDLPLCLLIREAGNQRCPDTHIKRGEEDLLSSSSYSSSQYMIMVDIKDKDNLLRLQTDCPRYNLSGTLTRHQLYILTMWCNKCQRIQALIQK